MNSHSNRNTIYDREADFFDYEAGKNRKNLSFLYSGSSLALVRDQLFRFAGDLTGKRVLEYGCGNGNFLLRLAGRNAAVVGIELSKRSVLRANQRLKHYLPTTRAIALPMNAEKLGFEDNAFDIVWGTAILHHLDLRLGLPEIRRILKPGGVGIFLEARGDNYLLNLYRSFTPSQRTPDEHPLVESDFELLRSYFQEVEIVNFYFIALLSFALRLVWKNEAAFVKINKLFTRLDHRLINVFPFLGRFCWIAAIRVKKAG